MEIVKKDSGVDPKNLTNKEKMVLVDTLKNEYPLKDLLGYVGMARSSYFYHRKIASTPGKYEKLQCLITKLFDEIAPVTVIAGYMRCLRLKKLVFLKRLCDT